MEQDSSQTKALRRAFDTIRGYLCSVVDTHERGYLYRCLETLYEAALTAEEKSGSAVSADDASTAQSSTS